MDKKTKNYDLKHHNDSWNVNYWKYGRIGDGLDEMSFVMKDASNFITCRSLDYKNREFKNLLIDLPKVYGPIAHIICNYHNFLLDANKEVYDLWRLLYQYSDIKDL
jgi:hypothetical protein